jgi:hypothetical protein
MNNGVLYRAAIEAEERITAKMNRFRQARNEVSARGLALDANADDAREVYISALAQLGVPRDEVRSLTSFDLQRVLRLMPTGGSRNRRSAMAFDATRKKDALDDILGDIPPVVDLSDR